MQVITQITALKDAISHTKAQIGFIPTMGALHAGHLSLIEESKKHCRFHVVSIFVNPTQFGPNEDFHRYPRTLESDLAICQNAGVDLVFTPSQQSMYPSLHGFQIKAPSDLANILEGKIRKGHFDGVAQIVLKLLCLISPHKVFFGKKDAQQLLIIQRLIADLFLPTTLIACPTIRTKEGLALSSRNQYLSPNGKLQAIKISQALQKAQDLIAQGEHQSTSIKQAIAKTLEGLEVEYIAITNHALQDVQSITYGQTLILIAARIEGVRLLDNLWVE